jgi:chemotaxis protein MotB
MIINLTAAGRIIPLTALMLGACVSQSAYEKQGAELQQARAQSAAEQSQIGKMQQEEKWVVAGDMLFPEGGYQLSANGKQAQNQYIPKLQNLQNAKVVVYGYTDNLQVGPALQRSGIANNIDLSSRRADNVVAYLEGQGVTRTSCQPRGSATRIRSPRTIRRTVGRKTAASRSCWKAPARELKLSDRRMPGTTPQLTSPAG